MKDYIYIETFGCSANQNNSEILKGLLKQAGYEITNNEKIADILILNTCIVKQKTENKIKTRIQDLAKIYQHKLTIITGCIPETNPRQIKKLNPNTILLGTHHFKDVLKLIRDYNENKLSSQKQNEFLDYQKEQKINLPKIPNNKLISITQISEGCLGNCSFCKTRLAKGKLFSYSEEDILKSIESDLKNGAKEIWLTSQDNANYGMDKQSISSQNISAHNRRAKRSTLRYQTKNQKLPELLNKILSLKHNFKLRLGMMDPNNILPLTDKLIEIYKNEKMYNFLHIPIQSASNNILKHMNRLYTIKQAENIINKFQREIPNITISTDIIVGYPTETDFDHQANLQFIKKFKPSVFNLSKFSPHKETKAGILQQLESDIVHKRASELMSVHRDTAKKNKKKFLGKNINIFINKKLGQELYEARDNNYNIILVNSKEKILGKNVNVKIKDIGVHHMVGDFKLL